MKRALKMFLLGLAVIGLLIILSAGYLIYKYNNPSDNFIPYEKPASVPELAIWSGGPDGGAWVRILSEKIDENGIINAVIYGDYSGDIWYEGRLQLNDFKPSDLKVDFQNKAHLQGWDGDHLHLKDGRYFKAIDNTK